MKLTTGRQHCSKDADRQNWAFKHLAYNIGELVYLSVGRCAVMGTGCCHCEPSNKHDYFCKGLHAQHAKAMLESFRTACVGGHSLSEPGRWLSVFQGLHLAGALL